MGTRVAKGSHFPVASVHCLPELLVVRFPSQQQASTGARRQTERAVKGAPLEEGQHPLPVARRSSWRATMAAAPAPTPPPADPPPPPSAAAGVAAMIAQRERELAQLRADSIAALEQQVGGSCNCAVPVAASSCAWARARAQPWPVKQRARPAPTLAHPSPAPCLAGGGSRHRPARGGGAPGIPAVGL